MKSRKMISLAAVVLLGAGTLVFAQGAYGQSAGDSFPGNGIGPAETYCGPRGNSGGAGGCGGPYNGGPYDGNGGGYNGSYNGSGLDCH